MFAKSFTYGQSQNGARAQKLKPSRRQELNVSYGYTAQTQVTTHTHTHTQTLYICILLLVGVTDPSAH